MSLRVRMSLILAGALALTVMLAWFVAGRVVKPFAKQVYAAHLDQAVHAADEIEAGANPKKLGEQLGLQISLSKRLPARMKAKKRRRKGHHCGPMNHRGRELVFCRAPRVPVSVKSNGRWVNIRREIDFDGPHKQFGRFLLTLLIGVLIIGGWMASMATRPLRKAQAAMKRVAAGELDHRLEESGPKELAAAARSFNVMAERVEEMLRTERALMAGISHELRTPLARLRLETEILRDSGGVSDKRLDAMDKDLEEIDELIGELLEISRLSLGERTLSLGPISLRAIADAAVERIAPENHKVEVVGDGERLHGDHDRLVRVVANLVQNAEKYSPKDTTITVRIDGRSIEVSDEGPGVPEHALPKLFEPFYRVDGQKARAAGLGLGLMIVHQIVTLHGGTIAARNLGTVGGEQESDGGGLAVKFELPAQVS